MCKGAEEEKSSGGGRLCRSFIPEEIASHDANRGIVLCELCSSQASLYCQADDAFLCRKCDRSVHNANFLALRHIRCFLCNTCQNLTQSYLIGASVEVVLPTLVSWAEGSLYKKSTQKNCSRELKRPFLFL
ncbi:Zinc finger, B-box [Quillaja saponaria]|uniref:Zinc finger, B-box n=1 Tax=Quillaja saponaria TaxID=32244 RepID=A0AAD7VMI4_QUISA|nr:Zinc finger, B-box [Quillaja saponaria]